MAEKDHSNQTTPRGKEAKAYIVALVIALVTM